MAKRQAPQGESVRFVAWFRHPKTGRVVRASDFGLKGFPIRGGRPSSK